MKALVAGVLFAVLGVTASGAQELSFDIPVKAKTYIVYAAEPQTVAAGKKSVVEMHFKVQEGFHVNSHTPRSELLIPTNLTLGFR